MASTVTTSPAEDSGARRLPALGTTQIAATYEPLPLQIDGASWDAMSSPVRDRPLRGDFPLSSFDARSPILFQQAAGTRGAYTDLRDGVRGDALARAYYTNDQRIEASGLEEVFGAEGIIAGGASRECNGWNTGVVGELYLNQPFDGNILVDSAERRSYRGNFERETIELSQLYLHARYDDFFFALGKMVTPFGRTYFPVYQNDRLDAPFIRTESILWRETGFLMQYDPGIWTLTAALTNGGPNRDANSSKAIVSRIGIDDEHFALGASVKWQDGIGSEDQKTYNDHVGLDAMYRSGRWTFSSEVIYDRYGFRQPGFDPNDITWGRSIYYRDQNIGMFVPITGVGYYVDVTHEGDKWLLGLNYGQFHPKQIGDTRHDVITRRGILKAVRHLNSFTDVYASVIIENDVAGAQANRTRSGRVVLVGFQMHL